MAGPLPMRPCGKPWRATQTTITNSLGQKTVYRHAMIAGEHRLLEVRANGCSTCGDTNLRYGYDKLGRLTETVKLAPDGRPLSASRIEPDNLGRPRQLSHVSYIAGKAQAPTQVRYEYSAGGAPVLVARPSVVPGKEMVTRIAYNDADQPLRVEVSGWSPQVVPGKAAEPITRTTTYTYRKINGRSLLSEIDGPLPNGPLRNATDSDITRFDYDATGSFVVRTTSPGNMSTEVLKRDDALRPTLVRSGDGVRIVDVSTSYATDGQISGLTQRASLAGVTDPDAILVRTTRFGHDASDMLVTVTGPDGVTMRTDYDAAGRPVALIDPKGNRVDSSFDSPTRWDCGPGRIPMLTWLAIH